MSRTAQTTKPAPPASSNSGSHSASGDHVAILISPVMAMRFQHRAKIQSPIALDNSLKTCQSLRCKCECVCDGWERVFRSRVLCILLCVLCTVYCVLCTVYCVLCTVYCVLCTVYCVLCTVYCVLCTVYCVLCTVYCVLCTVYCVLCTVYRVTATVPCGHCATPRAHASSQYSLDYQSCCQLRRSPKLQPDRRRTPAVESN